MSGAAPRSRNTVSDPSWSFEMVVRPWCPATPSARHNSFGGNVRLRGQDPQRFIDYERAAEPDEMSSPLRRIHQGEDEPRIDDALIACVRQIQKGTTGEPLPNYNRPSSRARLTAALRCSTRSLRYTARWWVFTVLSETYSRSPISRRDNRVARRRRTSSSLGVSSSSTADPSPREAVATPAPRTGEANSVEAMLASAQPCSRVSTSSRLASAVRWSSKCSKISALTNSVLAISRIAPPWRADVTA